MNPEEQPTEVEQDTVEMELVEDEFEELDVESLLPTMTVNPEMMQPERKECLVKDDEILGLYGEILTNCRSDREKADEILSTFLEMVINDSDASTAAPVLNMSFFPSGEC